MSIPIPWTRVASVAIRPVLFSGNQEGSLGGADLPVPRLGDRFALDVQTTPFQQDAEGRLFIAALMQASTLDGVMPLYQPAIRPPIAGNPVVDGAGQTGSTLNVRGYPNGSVAIGQFFNVIHGGVRFTYMATAGTLADGSGKMAIPIWPMLRFISVDAEPLDFVPQLEGRLTGFDKGATFVKAKVDALQFSITERA